jgi:hypothetical protein
MIPWTDLLTLADSAYTDPPYIAADDCYVLRKEVGDSLVWSFRGSQSLIDWISDFLIGPWPSADHNEIGPVHAGLGANVAGVIDQIARESAGRNVGLVGHSKGAGNAILAAGHLIARGVNVTQLAAFEAPHVAFLGNTILPALIARIPHVLATKNGHGLLFDPVCVVPPGDFFTPCPVTTLACPTLFLDVIDYHLLPNVRPALEMWRPA